MPRNGKTSSAQVRKIPAHEPEARDEGPRLIPFPDKASKRQARGGPNDPMTARICELADVALATKTKHEAQEELRADSQRLSARSGTLRERAKTLRARAAQTRLRIEKKRD